MYLVLGLQGQLVVSFSPAAKGAPTVKLDTGPNLKKWAPYIAAAQVVALLQQTGALGQQLLFESGCVLCVHFE